MVVFDGLDAEGRGDVGFARARTSDQNNVVSVLKKLATIELADERFVDLAAGKIEAVEVAVGREASGLELEAVDRTSRSAVSAFRSCDKIGMAASKAGEPCSVSSLTACAMPCILRLRSMTTMAPLAGL